MNQLGLITNAMLAFSGFALMLAAALISVGG